MKVAMEPGYSGPTILELESILDSIEDEIVQVRWTNSKEELHILSKYPNRKFILFVTDQSMLDKTTVTFGAPLKIERSVTERAKIVLVDPRTYDWRNFVDSMRDSVSPRNIVLKLAADAVRKGLQPKLAELVGPLMLDGVAAADVDVLLRLKSVARTPR